MNRPTTLLFVTLNKGKLREKHLLYNDYFEEGYFRNWDSQAQNALDKTKDQIDSSKNESVDVHLFVRR